MFWPKENCYQMQMLLKYVINECIAECEFTELPAISKIKKDNCQIQGTNNYCFIIIIDYVQLQQNSLENTE